MVNLCVKTWIEGKPYWAAISGGQVSLTCVYLALLSFIEYIYSYERGDCSVNYYIGKSKSSIKVHFKCSKTMNICFVVYNISIIKNEKGFWRWYSF